MKKNYKIVEAEICDKRTNEITRQKIYYWPGRSYAEIKSSALSGIPAHEQSNYKVKRLVTETGDSMFENAFDILG